jgi:hypothetical protein
MKDVIKFLKEQGAQVSEGYRERIEEWRGWYRGQVKHFHEYAVFNGQKRVTHRRLTLGMPKKAAEDWANLLLNEKVTISTDSKKFNETLDSTLKANKFWSRGNQLIEKAFALGTGALVEWKDADDNVIIDYVEADMIFPVTVENGDITECAFASEVTVEGKPLHYVQVHRKKEVQNYLVDKKGKQVALPPNLLESYPVTARQFQIIKPNIVNNVDFREPLGISVFANALDAAKGCDVIFDSMINDFQIGRSRIMVPQKFAQIQQVADGTKRPIFDKDDTVFYVYEASNDAAKMDFVQPQIRADMHVSGINRVLALFSDKCGLGNDRYRYDGQGLQTATAVISEKSELYQNVQKHQIPLREVLVGMVEAIASLSGGKFKEVSIQFDDSIIEDKAARKAQFIAEINAGIREAWEYRVEFLAEDEKTARMNSGQIREKDLEQEPGV